MVLSKTKPSDIARNMLLERMTVITLSRVTLPVLIDLWFSSISIHFGNTREKNNEKPRMNRFLVEFRSTNCRLDRPTAVMIPNMTEKMPPIIKDCPRS